MVSPIYILSLSVLAIFVLAIFVLSAACLIGAMLMCLRLQKEASTLYLSFAERSGDAAQREFDRQERTRLEIVAIVKDAMRFNMAGMLGGRPPNADIGVPNYHDADAEPTGPRLGDPIDISDHGYDREDMI